MPFLDKLNINNVEYELRDASSASSNFEKIYRWRKFYKIVNTYDIATSQSYSDSDTASLDWPYTITGYKTLQNAAFPPNNFTETYQYNLDERTFNEEYPYIRITASNNASMASKVGIYLITDFSCTVTKNSSTYYTYYTLKTTWTGQKITNITYVEDFIKYKYALDPEVEKIFEVSEDIGYVLENPD